jgi:hypothetical protein
MNPFTYIQSFKITNLYVHKYFTFFRISLIVFTYLALKNATNFWWQLYLGWWVCVCVSYGHPLLGHKRTTMNITMALLYSGSAVPEIEEVGTLYSNLHSWFLIWFAVTENILSSDTVRNMASQEFQKTMLAQRWDWTDTWQWLRKTDQEDGVTEQAPVLPCQGVLKQNLVTDQLAGVSMRTQMTLLMMMRWFQPHLYPKGYRSGDKW